MANAKVASAKVTIEDLTLTVKEEIHVRASIAKTFETLLEQLGPMNEVPEVGPMPMKTGSVARWPLVPRPRRRERPLLGPRAGDQTTDAVGAGWSALYVLSRLFQSAISPYRRARRHVDQVPSLGTGPHRRRSPQRCGEGLVDHSRARKSRRGTRQA